MNLIQALAKGRDLADKVVGCWEDGNLAEAVRQLAAWLDESGAAIAPELFHYARLPTRDDTGRVVHPDVDLIVPEELRDDEYNLVPFLQGVGLEWHAVVEEIPDGFHDLLWFNPVPPHPTWRLLSIDDDEDGNAIATYVRKAPKPDKNGYCSCTPWSTEDVCPVCGGITLPF